MSCPIPTTPMTFSVLISTRSGVKENLDTSTALGDQWELEVSRLFSAQGLIKDGLNTENKQAYS